MQQIRENIYEITYAELGRPAKKGDVKVDNLGTLMLDVADFAYVEKMNGLGYEPTFFVSKSAALGGRFVVVGRQQKA